MRKVIILSALTFFVLSITPVSHAGTTLKAGVSCAKLNQVSVAGGLKFTCVKSGNKLVWSKGLKIQAQIPLPVVSSGALPVSTPSPSSGSIGSGIFSSGEFAPKPVANAQAGYSGEDIVLTFSLDPSDPGNRWLDQLYIDIYDPVTASWHSIAQAFGTNQLNHASPLQKLTLSFEMLASTGISDTTKVSNVRIATSDAVLEKSAFVETGALIKSYSSPFDTPVITVSKG
jgi:hypothetical protein